MFHMLCRIKLFSNVHRTEIVLVMGRELTMREITITYITHNTVTNVHRTETVLVMGRELTMREITIT